MRPTVRSLRASGHVMVAVAMFFVAGGHWAALQTVAWAGMLWTYSQENGSLVIAAKKTFDGEHPCQMCQSIKAAKQKENKAPATTVSAKKIEALPAPLRATAPMRTVCRFVFSFPADCKAEGRFESPPVPVPIGALHS